MIVNRKIIVLSLLIGIGLMSCKKEGCIDTDAKNYNADAKTDDGSCAYEAPFVVYFNQSTADNLTADGITNMEFYLGGKSLGTMSVADYATSIPECGGSVGLSTTVDLGADKETFDFEFRCLNSATGEAIVYQAYPGIDANMCRQYEMHY